VYGGYRYCFTTHAGIYTCIRTCEAAPTTRRSMQALAEASTTCTTTGAGFGCAYASAAAQAYARAVAQADASAWASAMSGCSCATTGAGASAMAFADAAFFKELYVKAEAEASAHVCASNGTFSYQKGY
jgi:hypothetical protein